MIRAVVWQVLSDFRRRWAGIARPVTPAFTQ
jgi:hypothetical protein